MYRLVFLVLMALTGQSQAQTYTAEVLSVIDGDTFKARIDLGFDISLERSVRLLNVDTPEIRGKCTFERQKAQEAKTALQQLLQIGLVKLDRVKDDKFAGRIDALVTVGGIDVAGALIAKGLARPYDGGKRTSWCDPT